MKTTLFSFVLTLFLAGMASAAIVPVQQAEQVARNIYAERYKALHHTEAGSIIFSEVITQRDQAGMPLIYIFNVSDDAGFVIITAHDNVYPILAYTFSGKFDPGFYQPAFSSWIDNYKKEIGDCVARQLPPDAEITGQWNKYAAVNKTAPPVVANVGPLLTTTWNQGCYYNTQCPTVTSGGQCGRAWTGCGATAMAQVMKYWNYPASGVGSHSYSWNSQSLSANFGATTYNWSNMPNNVTSANADVAQLMYHCGVSLDMNYGGSGSGCFFNYNSVMPTYWGYANTATNWIRLFTPDQITYETRIAAELDSLRPCLYRATDNSLGQHFFVCDGYQGSYPYNFHFNWGWGGLYDGYYYCSTMNPGGYSFVGSQGAVIRVMPPQFTTGNNEHASISKVNLFPNPATENVTLSFEHTASGNVGVTVLDMTGREVKRFVTEETSVNLDLEGLSKGMYQVNLQDEHTKLVKKLIIE